MSEALGDGSLAGSGLADEHGIVLGSAAEYLEHAAYFLVAADNGVELAGAGTLVEVDGVFGKGVIGLFGTLVGCLAALAQLFDGGIEFLAAESGVLEDGRGRRVYFENGYQQCLEGHILVAHLLGYVECFLKHIVRCAAQIRLLSRYLGESGYFGVDLTDDSGRVGSYLLEDKVYHRLALVDNAFEQAHRLDGLGTGTAGNLDGLLNGLLRFDGEIIEVHNMWR